MFVRVALLGMCAVLSTATMSHAQAATPQAATRGTAAISDAPNGTTRVRLSVAARALQRGDTLRSDDIAVVDTNIVWHWATGPDTTRAAVGWIARRPIASGEVLRYPAVSAPPIVNVGARVSLIYQDGPVRIVLTGVATNTAPLGAPVGVRIDPTRRLDGIAVAPNTVRLR
jgi:flagella basal body P-ring formation protein FlgA